MRAQPVVIACAAVLLAGCSNDAPSVTTPSTSSSSSVGHPWTTSGTDPAPVPVSPAESATADGPTRATTGSGVPLAGSRWSGTNSLGDRMTLHLKPDGQFDYSTNGERRDTTPGNDGWSQSGAQLVLTPNGAYATYTGVVTGNRYAGSARNVTGKTWTFSFTRTN